MSLRNICAFGIAGNFANHLEQAGESDDFKNIHTDENAPKGIFPVYLPNTDDFLSSYPFSHDALNLLKNENIQMEPEVALLYDVSYKDNKIHSLKQNSFYAYNDATIRKEGVDKISKKKNWGINSKGISKKSIKIQNNNINDFAICSYIKRDDKLIQYGENSSLVSYSYFADKLDEWIKNTFNNQQRIIPLENLQEHLKNINYPKQFIISIGATRYTDFGENNFLKSKDICFVVLYNKNIYNHNDIKNLIQNDDLNKENICCLTMEVK